jgi:cytochrome c oxidase subunit 3
MHEARPAFPYATLPQQQDAAQLGMWTFLATEVLFFGGLILAYTVYRYGYPTDFAEAGRHTKIAIGAINTAVLLTSSFLVAWGVSLTKIEAGRLAATLLRAAAGLGILFLALKGWEYLQEYEEHLLPTVNFQFAPEHMRGAQLFFLFYFIATALHGLHMGVGIVALLLIARRAGQGLYSARYHSPVTVTGLCCYPSPQWYRYAPPLGRPPSRTKRGCACRDWSPRAAGRLCRDRCEL